MLEMYFYFKFFCLIHFKDVLSHLRCNISRFIYLSSYENLQKGLKKTSCSNELLSRSIRIALFGFSSFFSPT